jgi:hypothetical protein
LLKITLVGKRLYSRALILDMKKNKFWEGRQREGGSADKEGEEEEWNERWQGTSWAMEGM